MSITIQNLNKSFQNFRALNNINLNVPTGKLTSLLGPSGCGKTTLLRIIAGLENADSGKILFDGQDVTDKHVRERKVGFVFQHYALFRHMNVFDNIAFGLTVLPKAQRPGKAEIRARVEELLQLVQLSHLAKSYPHQLSGGQRQRIALARALAVKPKLLLLDEPFGALDAKVRKELRVWLRDIHHELDITSILVTHDQEEALEVSDEIVVMNHGCIEQIGTADTLYRRPANAFVTEFLGETDAFEGRIEKGAWTYNGFKWSLDSTAAWQEQTATGYIRPHEWTIAENGNTPMLQARIQKIHAAGALTHLTMQPMHDKRDIHVSFADSEVAHRGLAVGQEIALTPKQIYIFSQNELIDYSI
ncbi:sulfate/molybdate ABC transporter ATP-binding protein [Neisseria sp. S1]|uniref:sulfate/molybdate ABC transporter ATP-binding protein n=1 Tax=Neisseria sp. S1 TaxID=3318354 RepID=UPI003A8925C7